jgi:hypothetical protein
MTSHFVWVKFSPATSAPFALVNIHVDALPSLDFFTPVTSREVGHGWQKKIQSLARTTSHKTESDSSVAVASWSSQFTKTNTLGEWFLLPDKPCFVGICNPLSVAHVGKERSDAGGIK